MTRRIAVIFLCAAVVIVLALIILNIDTDEPLPELVIFREQCLSNGTITCEWIVLEMYLENHIVSRVWWNLTRDERYLISGMAVRNTMPYKIYDYRHGEPNCAGGTGIWRPRGCVPQAIITHQKFAHFVRSVDSCYWRRTSSSNEVCYVPNKTYGLPVFLAHVPNHVLNAIQIQKDTESSNSWVLFQREQFDFCPSHGTTVEICEPTYFDCAGYSHRRIATFTV